MRLVIQRSQQDVKGMLGGHKGVQFTLYCQLQLTADEADLVSRYKLTEYPVTYRQVQGVQMPAETIGSLVRGSVQTVPDVTTLVGNERVIKDACDELPVLFQVCRSFGGQEVVEYPRAPKTIDLPDPASFFGQG